MDTAELRQYVMGRERELCRVCRIRKAESMHELTPRGRGGKRSKRNSVGVCGQLVGSEPSCHTYLQLNQIDWHGGGMGAESTLFFQAKTQAAADWLRVTLYHWIESPIMADTETNV